MFGFGLLRSPMLRLAGVLLLTALPSAPTVSGAFLASHPKKCVCFAALVAKCGHEVHHAVDARWKYHEGIADCLQRVAVPE